MLRLPENMTPFTDANAEAGISERDVPRARVQLIELKDEMSVLGRA